jgi:hypothetical protein
LSKPGLAEAGNEQAFEVFCGIDVAREVHHAVALDRRGRRLADRPLPNDETALRALFGDLAERGRLLVVVDQPASIGALAIAVARSMSIEVSYLPGLAMRRIADLYPRGRQDRRAGRVRHRRRGPHVAAHAAPGRGSDIENDPRPVTSEPAHAAGLVCSRARMRPSRRP